MDVHFRFNMGDYIESIGYDYSIVLKTLDIREQEIRDSYAMKMKEHEYIPDPWSFKFERDNIWVCLRNLEGALEPIPELLIILKIFREIGDFRPFRTQLAYSRGHILNISEDLEIVTLRVIHEDDTMSKIEFDEDDLKDREFMVERKVDESRWVRYSMVKQ